MNLPERKTIRLPEYDYSSPGAYFITICTQGKKNLFWDRQTVLNSSVGAAISRPQNATDLPCALSATGQLVERGSSNIPRVYPCVSVEKYVIMPNHIHMILCINGEESGRLVAAPTISTIVGQMKRWTSRQTGTSLWQKSFYEHVIRGERDYREIWEYMDHNPTLWVEDDYYTE